eukprot:TRINITY_DN6726_c0_g1_i3.p1 TRINITY_DN6726_c0_g1~~TRINITY_DN6726_c0_g1_i3.p1  ORF type:complete len:234 (+),score=78.71 TRINITY_DN6726_c0_g1_i3:361-1062(+)
MCWAASALGQEDVAERCFESFSKYIHPANKSGLVATPYGEGQASSFEADFFATAEVVSFALTRKQLPLAREAADQLVRVVRANAENMKQKGKFLLRWSNAGTGAAALVEAADALHCVNSKEAGQLYFMLGFPAMVLREVASEIGAPAGDYYVEAAQALLEFLKTCEGVWSSPMAHKVAVAAAMLGDEKTSQGIADFFLKQQTTAGCYQEDPDAMDSLDQTAEIAYWLQIIGTM